MSAKEALLGMCNWLVQWYSTAGRLSAAEIANEYSTLFVNRLVYEGGADAGGKPSAQPRSVGSAGTMMMTLYGLALGGALSRRLPDARDLIEQAEYPETLGYHSIRAPNHVMMRGPVTECVTLLGRSPAPRGGSSSAPAYISRRFAIPWSPRRCSRCSTTSRVGV